jgi:uncharacterized membrane protein
MERLLPLGRIFFALAFIGLGIEHFLFQDFVTGRAPAWPDSVPGGSIWAYLTGAAFIATGIALLVGKKARLASVLAAALILFWALLRHIPVVAADSLLAPTWTRAGKALAFFGGALAMAGVSPREDGNRNLLLVKPLGSEQGLLLVGRICLGSFLIVTGIQHFLFDKFVALLIPPWLPGDAIFWTYFGGVCLIAGGIGLFIRKTARLAAFLSGCMVFSWFWIIHVPRTFASVSDSIAIFEALAVSGIAFVLAGSPYAPSPGSSPPQEVPSPS